MSFRYPAATGAFVAALALGLSACGGAAAPGPESNTSTGPITLWYSNNPEEVAWSEDMVKQWNSAHPDQIATGQQIPAGKTSEEVIFASVVAGSAPCLILNTAPSAVPMFQKAGGLVDLGTFPGSTQYIEARTGVAEASQFKSPGGQYFQFPWKANPVMIFYNKKLFKKAGLDPDHPKLSTYADFLDTSRKLVSSGAAKAAIYPAPSSEFFQPWFDFYPLYAADSRKQLVENGKATFATDQGQAVAQLWKTMYQEKLAPKEKYNGDSFLDGVAAMSIVGPWAIPIYADKVEWGSVPVPTPAGMPADQGYTFSDAKNIGLFSACKNRLSAWEFIKFVTTQENDGKWLQTTGQMPLRQNLPTTYPDYFVKHPAYTAFASQTARLIEVPFVNNSIEIWQTFRGMWTQAVIFGEGDLRQQIDDTAAKIDKLVVRR
ncbi:MAG: extracellular solute-binding protein [Actinomycetes bacterium]